MTIPKNNLSLFHHWPWVIRPNFLQVISEITRLRLNLY